MKRMDRLKQIYQTIEVLQFEIIKMIREEELRIIEEHCNEDKKSEE